MEHARPLNIYYYLAANWIKPSSTALSRDGPNDIFLDSNAKSMKAYWIEATETFPGEAIAFTEREVPMLHKPWFCSG